MRGAVDDVRAGPLDGRAVGADAPGADRMQVRCCGGGAVLLQLSGPTSTRVLKESASRAARERTSPAPTAAIRSRVSSTLV